MPKTTESISFQASQSLPAAQSVTGSAVDLREKHGALLTARVTNGATGPGAPVVFSVEVSRDNFLADVRTLFAAGSKTANNAITDFPVPVAYEVMWARTKFDNTAGGQAVTVEAGAHVVKALG